MILIDLLFSLPPVKAGERITGLQGHIVSDASLLDRDPRNRRPWKRAGVTGPGFMSMWHHSHVGLGSRRANAWGWRVWGCHLEILTDFIPDFVSVSAVPWDSGAYARGLKPQFRSSPAPTPAWQGALLPAAQPPPRNSCCPEDRLWEGQAPASVH